MSSYHSKFKYLNKDSKNDMGWIIVHFDADNGEVDSYLSQEQVYTNSYNGAKRILYGTKWDSVSLIKITVIKQDGSNFSLAECRSAYRWLTGNPSASWLDLYVDDEVKYSYLCTVKNVKQQKLDARTVGMSLEFESISPWAYSPVQTINCSFGQKMTTDVSGVLTSNDQSVALYIDDNGVVYNNNGSDFNFTNEGVITQESLYATNYFNGNSFVESSDSSIISINNQSDDLYTYVYMDMVFTNNTGGDILIRNQTLCEDTIINGLSANEVITLNSGQFITSDKPNKIFGNTFNFVWPRLGPGVNEFVFSSSGEGSIQFRYRYPMKVGDCAMDVEVHGSELNVC